MPGETYGIPNQQGMPQYADGLLNNPALQMGLGILANNQGNYGSFGAAIGKGGLQGIQNIQQQQAFNQSKQMNELRRKQAENEMKQQELQNKAIEEATAKNPELAGLFRLDPKAAIKALYPQSNAPDPYFTPIATEQGLGSYDNRTGRFTPIDVGGRPVIKSTDSPLVRGGVKEAEARAQAGYDISTAIPGVVTTGRQIAEQANPSLGRMPLMRIPPNVQSQRDDKRLQILLAEQQNEGGAGRNPELDKEISRMTGGGIRVPTPEQQAALTEQAKKQASNQLEAVTNLPSIIQEGKNTVQLVDDLLKAPGFKQAVGGSRLFGVQNIPGTAAKDFDIRLDQLKGKQFLQAFESLKGGGQITEVEGRKATDAISRMNASASEKEFQNAAREFQNIIKQGVARAESKAGGILPNNAQMPVQQQAPAKRPPMKGQVVGGYKFKGGNPADPANWELK